MNNPRAASRNRSPWIAWYGQDFRDGVVEMSDAAAGVYAKLLSYQIVKGSIPDPKRNLNECAKAAVTTPRKLTKVWPEIEGKFAPCDGERLENPRCSQEIAIRDGIRASRSAGAKITNERRAQRSAQRPVERSASRARSTSSSSLSSKEDSTHPPAKASGAAARPVLAGKGKCSLEEAIAYAQERGFPPSDGIAFHDALEANGWRTRVGPLKDWKAAFRTKEINGWLASQQKNGAGAPPKGSKNAGTMNEGMSSQYRRQTP